MNNVMDRSLEGFPEALKPLHSTPSPNTTINLFEGDLVLTLASGDTLSTRGTVEWRWLPSPTIRFACSGLDHYPKHSDLSDAKLDIPALDLSCEAFVTSMGMGQGDVYCGGLLRTPVLVGKHSHCDQVVFHLPNFHSYTGGVIRDKGASWTGRLRLQSDEWQVALDARRAERELVSGLKDQGGYAITHTGEVMRADHGGFGSSEADDVMQALYYFLSFVRGLWCGPVLALGRTDGVDTWQQWAASRLTPWKNVESWFPYAAVCRNASELSQAFRGFMCKWSSSLWRDPIKNTIHWYVESNIGAGGVEGAIVLTQAALELLSWLYFVEDPATAKYSVKCWEQANAAAKIRGLLKASGVPQGIPASLDNLQSEAAVLQAPDGPEAFVRLRNAIVHPKESKRKVVLQTSVPARVEAWDLGLWYLELVLLWILGYEGEYYQRFVSGRLDQAVAKVPWA